MPFSSGFAAWPDVFVCDVCGALAADAGALEVAALPWTLGAPLDAGEPADEVAWEAEARVLWRLVLLTLDLLARLFSFAVPTAFACRS